MQILTKKHFVSDCLDNFEVKEFIAFDIIELRQIIKNGQKISLDEFLEACEIVKKKLQLIKKYPMSYKFFKNDKVYWIYDSFHNSYMFYI